MDGWTARLIERARRKEVLRSESALHEASYGATPLNAIEEILRLHPEANFLKDDNGRIPLHWTLASKKQHPKARLLLQSMMEHQHELNINLNEILLIRNDLGYTALDHACCSDCPPDILETLLKICPKAAQETNPKKMGKTPLHMLIEYNKSNHVSMNSISIYLLLKAFCGAVSVKDRIGNIPLHYACYPNTNYNAFQLLLQATKKADAVMERNSIGQTALHFACMFDAPKLVVEDLLHFAPSSVSCRDDGGNTPLHLAFSHRSSLDLKQSLILFGGEMLLAISNEKNKLPLQEGHVEDIYGILRLMPHIVKPSIY